jgi:hypothetical protein
MPEQHSWERVPEDSPDRCQAVIATRGQCLNKRCDGSDFCPAHGGNRAGNEQKKQEKRLYNLQKWQDRLDEKATHSKLKGLTDEIGILRMILESRLNSCKDDFELMLHSQSISQMAGQIEKLVVSLQKLDMQMEKMLDETQAVAWAQSIVEIVGQYIADTEVLTEIADRISASYDRIQKGETA